MKGSRFNIFLITIFLLITVSFGVELHYMRLESLAFPIRLALLLLLNLTIIALLILMFFVGKSIVKLYFERKYKILGYKFKTKLVITLVVLTLIPAAFLFFVASGLITSYIDRWFSPQIKQPLLSSIEIAKTLYEIERQKTLDYARTPHAGKTSTEKFTVRHLSEMPKDATETVKAAFDGREGTEVISDDKGDIIRAVVPAFKNGRMSGVLIVESIIPGKITRNVENIKDAYENYLTLETWKMPIKANYLSILGFLTVIVVFMALWIALRISKGITDPIQILAQATEAVAAGNLDTKVSIEREDEIGLLVTSFNHMVKELKEAEESLQSACLVSDRRRLVIENILDNINSGVVMLDTTGAVRVINKRACSILDIDPEQMVNRNYRELISIIKSEELHKLVDSIEGREFKPVRKEIKAVIGNKKVILLIFITSLKDSQTYIGLLVVFDDLTEVIEAQKALTWQDIARKIAHEIKNPLTPIKLSAERMIKKWEHKDPDFGEVCQRSARTIVKEVDSLKRLVDAFSKFGKMPEIHKTPTSIPMVIDEVVNLYKDFNKVEIRVSAPDNPPPVELDGEQFRRVLINIFDNAIQAMSNSGRIDVELSFNMPSNMAYIEIADNGPGIKDEYKEKLFLPNFSTKKDGTGLGLAIANRIVKEHGGNIRIRDNSPHGTVFTLEVPVKEG